MMKRKQEAVDEHFDSLFVEWIEMVVEMLVVMIENDKQMMVLDTLDELAAEKMLFDDSKSIQNK